MEEEGKKGSLGLWVTRQPLPSKRDSQKASRGAWEHWHCMWLTAVSRSLVVLAQKPCGSEANQVIG